MDTLTVYTWEQILELNPTKDMLFKDVSVTYDTALPIDWLRDFIKMSGLTRKDKCDIGVQFSIVWLYPKGYAFGVPLSLCKEVRKALEKYYYNATSELDKLYKHETLESKFVPDPLIQDMNDWMKSAIYQIILEMGGGYKNLTLKRAKKLSPGTILHHGISRNADGTPARWRVNGKVKLWKRNPNRISIPIKHGLQDFGYLTENNYHNFFLEV